MITDPIHHPAPEPILPADRAGPVLIAYRITVLLLLGACAWFLSRSPQVPQVPALKPALSLPGTAWRLEYEIPDLNGKKEWRSGILEFRADGSVAERGSGQGTFEILSPDEILLDPKGLFSWAASQKGVVEADRWVVTFAGSNLVLQRKSDSGTQVFLRRAEEQNDPIVRELQRLQNELAEQGRARKSENEAIRREIQLLREAEKKRIDEGKK